MKKTLQNSVELISVLKDKKNFSKLYKLDTNPGVRVVEFSGKNIFIRSSINARVLRRMMLGTIRDFLSEKYSNVLIDNTMKPGGSKNWPLGIKLGDGTTCRIFAKVVKDASKEMEARDYINSPSSPSEVLEFLKGKLIVKAPCWVFDNATKLKKVILQNIEDKDVLPEEQRTAINKLFRNHNAINPELKESPSFLIYFGEVFFPWLVLAKKESLTDKPVADCKVYFPKSDSFSTFDSLIKIFTQDGEELIFKISNKFSGGAAASIWKVFEVIEANYGDKPIPDCLAKTLMEYRLQNRGATHTLWDYFLHERWGLNIPGKEAYLACKANKPKDPIVAKVKKACPAEVKTSKSFPFNLTNYFSVTLANELMADKVSLSLIKAALSSADIFQIDISEKSAMNGKFAYKLTRSKDSKKLSIIGNKSASDDITAKQGTINYRIA